MGFFSDLFGKKKQEESTAARLDGLELQFAARRYLDENGNPTEEGLGHGGRINTAHGHVIITCGGKDVFINDDIEAVECGELMSLKGAIFTGYNQVSGRVDSIIVYYTSRFRQ